MKIKAVKFFIAQIVFFVFMGLVGLYTYLLNKVNLNVFGEPMTNENQFLAIIIAFFTILFALVFVKEYVIKK